jgi:RNA-directed DNA polymerase
MRTDTIPKEKCFFNPYNDRTCAKCFAGGCATIHGFDCIISRKSLYEAWKGFVKGKKYKKDVADFSLKLDSRLRDIHYSLKLGTYTHGTYVHFRISDPKPRDIHKALVKDRLVHHLLYNAFYPYFDNKFIFDSYSCRDNKGTHRAMERFKIFIRKVGKNNTKTVWVLKCDIRKFFASIDHEILFSILKRHIKDDQLIRLLKNIVDSFKGESGKRLPLGNLTSQLLVNVYMNEFDQYVKHTLKQKYYIRYADDFVFLSTDKKELENLLPVLTYFLEEKLKLSLHPDKVFIKTIASGVDFLGWMQFPTHRVLRTCTKKRMLKQITNNKKPESVASYRGMLSHGNSFKLTEEIDKIVLSNCS